MTYTDILTDKMYCDNKNKSLVYTELKCLQMKRKQEFNKHMMARLSILHILGFLVKLFKNSTLLINLIRTQVYIKKGYTPV